MGRASKDYLWHQTTALEKLRKAIPYGKHEDTLPTYYELTNEEINCQLDSLLPRLKFCLWQTYE